MPDSIIIVQKKKKIRGTGRVVSWPWSVPTGRFRAWGWPGLSQTGLSTFVHNSRRKTSLLDCNCFYQIATCRKAFYQNLRFDTFLFTTVKPAELASSPTTHCILALSLKLPNSSRSPIGSSLSQSSFVISSLSSERCLVSRPVPSIMQSSSWKRVRLARLLRITGP